MPQNVTWNGVTYAIPLAGELNWATLSNFLIALGNNAAVAEEAKQTIRVALTTPVTVVAATDYAVVTDLTSPGAVTVNLPAGVDKQIFIIVDGKGDALTNNITINPNGADTIKGSASLVLNRNRQVAMLQYHALTTDWKLTNFSIPIGGVLSTDISGVVAPSKGGTGVANNDAATLTRTGNFDLAVTLGAATAVDLGGDVTTGGDLVTSGAFDLTLTQTANTNVTLPTTGTLATLAGVEQLTNKDIATGTASNTSRVTVGSGTSAALGALTRKAGTILFDTDTNLFNGDDGSTLTPFASGAVATPSTPGIVSITAQSFGGLKTFEGGIASDEYVGTDPEVGGSSPFQLTVAHKRIQTITPAGDITVMLPTTDVLAGDSVTISNLSINAVTVQASGGGTKNIVVLGYARYRALVNTPTLPADWVCEESNSMQMLRVQGLNGNGSAATAIQRYDTLRYNYGSAITRSSDATDSEFWTINEPGVYYIKGESERSDSGNNPVGLTLNDDATEVMNTITSVAADRVLCIMDSTRASAHTTFSWTGYLQAGDEVRVHLDGSGEGISNINLCSADVVKVRHLPF